MQSSESTRDQDVSGVILQQNRVSGRTKLPPVRPAERDRTTKDILSTIDALGER